LAQQLAVICNRRFLAGPEWALNVSATNVYKSTNCGLIYCSYNLLWFCGWQWGL